MASNENRIVISNRAQDFVDNGDFTYRAHLILQERLNKRLSFQMSTSLRIDTRDLRRPAVIFEWASFSMRDETWTWWPDLIAFQAKLPEETCQRSLPSSLKAAQRYYGLLQFAFSYCRGERLDGDEGQRSLNRIAVIQPRQCCDSPEFTAPPVEGMSYMDSLPTELLSEVVRQVVWDSWSVSEPVPGRWEHFITPTSIRQVNKIFQYQAEWQYFKRLGHLIDQGILHDCHRLVAFRLLFRDARSDSETWNSLQARHQGILGPNAPRWKSATASDGCDCFCAAPVELIGWPNRKMGHVVEELERDPDLEEVQFQGSAKQALRCASRDHWLTVLEDGHGDDWTWSESGWVYP